MNRPLAATAALTVFWALSAVAGTSLADDSSAATNKIITRPPALTDAELQPFAGKGTASITGRLFAQLPGDRLRAFPDAPVYAIPLVPYTFWYVHEINVGWAVGRTPSGVTDNDGTLKRLMGRRRLAISNNEGIFRFANLPAGKWVVYSVLLLRDGRAYTRASTSEYESMDYVGVQRDEEGGYQPQFAPIPHSQTSYSTERYTCQTQGLLTGEIDAPSDRSLSIPLALIGGRNEGC